MKDGVALMTHIAMRPGDVPSSPTIFKTSTVVGKVGCSTKGWHSIGIGIDRGDHDSGHAKGAFAFVALQADVAAIEAGRFRLLIETIKDESLLGIHGGYLEETTAADVADHRIVVEID